MLETLISSKTRIKLLLKFFLNRQTIAYLRGLEAEFGESSNAIRLELNRFEKAGLLNSFNEGNKKFFQANHSHPLYYDINRLLITYTGLDQVIENISTRLGNVEKVYLAGSFSKGLDSPIIDLIILGKVDRSYLVNLIDKIEKLIPKKIRYIIYDCENDVLWSVFDPKPLLIWSRPD